MEAQQEQTRSCPRDQETMAKEVIHGVIIDRCPSCGGVWLDGGELDAIRHRVELGVATELFRGLPGPV